MNKEWLWTSDIEQFERLRRMHKNASTVELKDMCVRIMGNIQARWPTHIKESEIP